MIEIIEGFPDNILAVNCIGRVSRKDYEGVLIPAVVAKLGKHEKLRLLYRAGSAFNEIDIGAALDDAKIGFAHLSRWERVAVVTDVEWLRLMTQMFGLLMPSVKLFNVVQDAEARKWITESN